MLGVLAAAALILGLGVPAAALPGLADRLADLAAATWPRSVPSLGLLVGATAIAVGALLLGAVASNRARAERAARENEARMARMVDSAMDAVISVDADQRILVFNRAAEAMFQRPAAEVIGRPLDMLLPRRFRESHRDHIERFGAAAVTSRSMGSLGALSGLRADGQEFPIEASISRVEVGGDRIYTAIIRDISARVRTEKALRESEEMLRLALEAAGMGIWELDPRTGERRWSARSKALFGLPPEAEVDGQAIMARVHPADRPRLEHIMATLLGSGAIDELDVEFRLAPAEGREERWLHSRGQAFFEDGRAVRVVGTLLDITGRRRADEAIRASEGRYRTLFECAPDGILIADRDSYYTSANPSLCRMLGYSPGEIVGMHATDIVVAEEVEHIAPALATINGGSDYHREWRFRRKDGSTFPAEVIAAPMPEGDILAMIREVTERKVAEQALRDSEERFRTMANSMVQLAWIARADGHIYWYNDRWYEYTGTTPAQMEGWGWTIVHDPEVLPEVIARWGEAIAAGERCEMEFPLRGADGVFRTFLTRCQPLLDSEGRVVQWLGTNTDVDALKRAEERVQRLNAELEARVMERTAQLERAVAELEGSRAELQSLFESLPGLYLVLTTELVIVAVSDAYLAAILTTREAIVGRHLFEVFPDNPDAPQSSGAAAVHASLERVLRDGKPDTMAIQRYDVRRPDGTFEERYWSPIHSPMFGAERRIKYVIHRVEEVTDFVRQRAPRPADAPEPAAQMQQMEAEIFRSSQKLQAANQELEAANKELEAFSYSVSHDLRAPLRGVNGYVRIIQEDYADRLDAEGHRLLDVVADQAKRMGQLIDDLLEFSRLGRTPMRRREVDMRELARAVFESLTCGLPGPAPRLEIAALPPAQGDVAMLRQVFANLLENSIKFTRDRSDPVIEVGWSPASEAHAPAEVVYHVKDNGAGFDPLYGDKLFGVFQRLHTHEQFEGTGVGLALVQRVIQRHGGKVWADGKPGGGATFYFTVPAPRGPGA